MLFYPFPFCRGEHRECWVFTLKISPVLGRFDDSVGGIGTIDIRTGTGTFEAASLPGEGYVIAVVSGVMVFGDATAAVQGTSKVVVKPPLPTNFALRQNYLNPFNPDTQIGFELSVASRVWLTMYNLAGQRVAELANQTYPPGTHQVLWDASGQPTGVYVYRLEAGPYHEQRKMLLLR